MSATVTGGDLAAIRALAALLAEDRRRLSWLAVETSQAVRTLRAVSSEPTIVLDPPPVDLAVHRVGDQLRSLHRDVDDVADQLRAADRRAATSRALGLGWLRLATGVRRLEQLTAPAIHDLPGLDWVPAPEAREATGRLWALALAIDETGRGRLASSVARAKATTYARADRVARAATQLWGTRAGLRHASLHGRVADVLGSPAVRGGVRVVGRLAVGLGIAVDVVDGVERAREGDGWGTTRSFAAAAGGAAIVAGGPIAVAGAAVVAGVYVYEHRRAIASSVRSGWRAGRRTAARATGDMLSGARRIVGGLF